MKTIRETLIEVGLHPSAAEIYLILVENGEMTVPAMLKKTKLSRAMVYEVLPELLANGHIEYRKEGREAYYRPAHPGKLLDLLEQKKRDVALLENEMKQTINTLSGTFNLAFHKPGVRFFEGREGFREALSMTLEATETIYTYADLDAVEKYVKDINDEYVVERRKRNINKKLLVLNTPKAQAFMQAQGGELSDTRFLPAEITEFHTGMQIYNNTVAYFTLRAENISAMIIHDPDIYRLHRNLFESEWKRALPIK